MDTKNIYLPLTEVPAGQICRIRSIESIHTQLIMSEFGLVQGSILEPLFQAPLGGPLVCQAKDFRFCIRREDAGQIQVEVLP